MGFCIVFQLKCEHNSTLLYSISPDYALKISNDLVFYDIQTPYNTHIDYSQYIWTILGWKIWKKNTLP